MWIVIISPYQTSHCVFSGGRVTLEFFVTLIVETLAKVKVYHSIHKLSLLIDIMHIKLVYAGSTYLMKFLHRQIYRKIMKAIFLDKVCTPAEKEIPLQSFGYDYTCLHAKYIVLTLSVLSLIHLS